MKLIDEVEYLKTHKPIGSMSITNSFGILYFGSIQDGVDDYAIWSWSDMPEKIQSSVIKENSFQAKRLKVKLSKIMKF